MMLMMIFLQVHYCTIFTPFHFACDSQDASNYVFYGMSADKND